MALTMASGDAHLAPWDLLLIPPLLEARVRQGSTREAGRGRHGAPYLELTVLSQLGSPLGGRGNRGSPSGIHILSLWDTTSPISPCPHNSVVF